MKKALITSLIVLLPLAGIYLYKVVDAYRFDSDFGRDLVDILHITKGDLTLIGPKLSFGGIHTGPYYYYLFAPVLLLSGFRPESLLIANAVFFYLALVLANIWLQKIEKWSFSRSTLSLYFIAPAPFFIFSARGPGNAFSYLPLMLLLLISFPWLLRQKKSIPWLIYGVLTGIVVNTHLVTVIIFLSLFLVALRLNKLKQYFALIVGGIVSYAPIFVFELRHDFVIFKNTFIQKSYLAFTNNTNLPNPLESSANPFKNFSLLMTHFTTWSGISFIVLLLLLIIIAIKQKQKSPLVWGSLLSIVILAFVARSQLAIHYFFPFILATLVGLTSLINSKKILLLLLVLMLSHFPLRLYSESPRKISHFRLMMDELSQTELIRHLDKNSFNIFVVRETPLAVLGWEYRYFLELIGFVPQAISAYAQSNQLLLIDEQQNRQVPSINSWEMDQFGNKYLVEQLNLFGRNFYLFSK